MTATTLLPQRVGACLPGCGKCCEFLELETNPAYLRNPDALHWINLHGITITMVSGRAIARLPIPCTALQEDKACGLYGTLERPKMCGVWPQSRAALGDITDCGYSFPEED